MDEATVSDKYARGLAPQDPMLGRSRCRESGHWWSWESLSLSFAPYRPHTPIDFPPTASILWHGWPSKCDAAMRSHACSPRTNEQSYCTWNFFAFTAPGGHCSPYPAPRPVRGKARSDKHGDHGGWRGKGGGWSASCMCVGSSRSHHDCHVSYTLPAALLPIFQPQLAGCTCYKDTTDADWTRENRQTSSFGLESTCSRLPPPCRVRGPVTQLLYAVQSAKVVFDAHSWPTLQLDHPAPAPGPSPPQAWPLLLLLLQLQAM